MKQLMFVTLAVFMLLGGVVLLVNVRAQASKQVQIAFSSDNGDGNDEICVMDVDGKNLRKLTDNPADFIVSIPVVMIQEIPIGIVGNIDIR